MISIEIEKDKCSKRDEHRKIASKHQQRSTRTPQIRSEEKQPENLHSIAMRTVRNTQKNFVVSSQSASVGSHLTLTGRCRQGER